MNMYPMGWRWHLRMTRPAQWLLRLAHRQQTRRLLHDAIERLVYGEGAPSDKWIEENTGDFEAYILTGLSDPAKRRIWLEVALEEYERDRCGESLALSVATVLKAEERAIAAQQQAESNPHEH